MRVPASVELLTFDSGCVRFCGVPGASANATMRLASSVCHDGPVEPWIDAEPLEAQSAAFEMLETHRLRSLSPYSQEQASERACISSITCWRPVAMLANAKKAIWPCRPQASGDRRFQRLHRKTAHVALGVGCSDLPGNSRKARDKLGLSATSLRTLAVA